MNGLRPTRMIGGRYVVLGGIGGGRAGAVWRAADRVTGRQVAVEELRLPPEPDERRLVRERMLRVARSAGRLDHPGLVKVHDAGIEFALARGAADLRVEAALSRDDEAAAAATVAADVPAVESEFERTFAARPVIYVFGSFLLFLL